MFKVNGKYIIHKGNCWNIYDQDNSLVFSMSETDVVTMRANGNQVVIHDDRINLNGEEIKFDEYMIRVIKDFLIELNL